METAVGTTATAGQQTPQGPTRPGHARTTPWHWALALAGCGAVVAAALAASPATGTPLPARGGTPKALAASAAPDPAKAQLPMDCGPFPVKTVLRVPADLGDGHPGTVVAAHCDTDTGTPPDSVYLLGFGPDGRPAVVATLLTDRENLTLNRLAVRSDGAITGHAQGYSSDDVPRFRPDVSLDLTWTHKGGGWVRSQSAAPVSAV
ncbi:hypothetical protein [Streptomyces sp. CBMA123]|uniref:hypothetical protein n=1 Tax=Streptomyces sp. CBMA123 TaxID=1896313 RepID=UPI001661C443|nr:hypothetical protein [Streptomyces sp. CBMA123]MBD0694376.1 hypothetical protein [Streptomyces sp. CBMA123]